MGGTALHAPAPLVVRQKGEHLIVDIHAHLNVAAAEDAIRAEIPDLPRGLPFSCPASDAVNARMFREIGPKLGGIAERLADMDRQGVDVQAISPNPGQYYYFAPAELGRGLGAGRRCRGRSGRPARPGGTCRPVSPIA